MKDKWKELDEEMRALNREIVREKKAINPKRPENEIEHMNRLIDR